MVTKKQLATFTALVTVLAAGVLSFNPAIRAQGTLPRSSSSGGTSSGDKEETTQVIIKREPAVLLAPKVYQTPLQMELVRKLDLVCLADGTVNTIHLKSGETVDAQAEVIRLDSTEQQLKLDRARAEFKAAEIEVRRAKNGGDADLVELAEAKMQAAKAGLDLADHHFRRTIVRAPFKGELYRVHVVKDQWTRAGDPLVTLGDSTQLRVEVPVVRGGEGIEPGKPITIRVGDANVEGKIEFILPLSEKFAKLRDLMDNLASATVLLDNSKHTWNVGQTVYSPLIPRRPVCEVPKPALHPFGDGQWVLQVVRDGVVRDVIVEPLARIGEERTYVTGEFATGDEIITSASQELPDGTQVRQQNAPAGNNTNSNRPRPMPKRNF